MKTRPIDADTLWKLDRVGSVSLSPDGRAAVCAVTSYSMEENKGRSALWLLPADRTEPRRLTHAGEKDGQPRWSPKGDRIAFLARREQEGKKDEERQLYVIASDGGEARRVSDFAPGIEDFKWMPDGERIAFVSWIWPDAKGPRSQAARHKAFGERKESGYATGEAYYRHWDRNLPMGRVPHLLVLDVASGRVTDLFEGTAHELPRADPSSSHFDISPDGRRIAFVHDPRKLKRADNPQAIAEIDVRTRRVTPLTRDAAWNYESPSYSPDGTRLACLAANVGRKHTMPNRLAILPLPGVPSGARVQRQRAGERVRVAGGAWPIDPEGPLRWSADSRRVLFPAQQRGRCHLWRYDVDRDALTVAVPGGWVQGFDLAESVGDEVLVVAIDSASHPVQVHHVRGGSSRRLERFNDDVLAAVALGETREVTLRGALGHRVQMFLTFPPRFDAARKHPVLHAIHGGPYAASGDTWGWRWNTHVLASRGHVVAAVNYHGSSGFGHAFHDAIVGRMGELEARDIEAGTGWLLRQRWVDRRRIYASGGSYGGFLVAYMNGHVPAGRYRAYVCHAGVFDRVATFSADSYSQRPKDLDALYWEDPAKVAAQSPVTAAGRMTTPTLVIHGALDYRVPDHNGLAYYNTLQMRGVPARLLWFPDENHWVLKPRNSRLWYQEVLDWISPPPLGGVRGEGRRRSRPPAT